MFVGHIALGFATKRWAPRVPLGMAIAAAQLPDMLWPAFLLAGVERATVAPGDTAVTPLRFDSYPISHSLLMTAVWGALAGVLYHAWRRDRRGAAALALLSVSHWLLDFVSHRPDMPLVPWSATKLGLGLWNSRPATLAVEGALLAAGVWIYAAAAQRDGRRGGRVALAWLVGTLAVLHLANMFGPPPPNMTAVAVSALVLVPVMWLWADWVDRRVGYVSSVSSR